MHYNFFGRDHEHEPEQDLAGFLITDSHHVIIAEEEEKEKETEKQKMDNDYDYDYN